MSRNPTEAQARAHLTKAWPDELVLVQPIESSTAPGIPDLYVWVPPHGWWLELKSGAKPLQLAQRRWLTMARRRGVPCGVLRVWREYAFTLYLGRGHAIHLPDANLLLQRLHHGPLG